MRIQLICLCGRGMSLPEEYADRHIECPNCHAMLHTPSAGENQSLTRWSCKCGLRLKARTRTAGRKVRCPRCSAEVAVPFTDSHPSYVEDNFVPDEAGGLVQLAPEKEPQQEFILEPENPGAGAPLPKDENTTADPLAPEPDVKPDPTAQPPDPAPKTPAKKSKKPRSQSD